MSYYYAFTQTLDWQQQAKWQTPDTPFMLNPFWQALTDAGAIGGQSGWLPIYVVIYEDKNGSSKVDDLLESKQDVGDALEKSDTIGMLDGDESEYDDEDEPLSLLDEDAIKPKKSAPIAVMPIFIKGHHQGEYVFDHAWAEAYGRYGLDYYPRLVTSVPYTPVTGERLWLADGTVLDEAIMKTALRAVDDLAIKVGASSWHGLFFSEPLAQIALEDEETRKSATTSNWRLFERQGNQFLWHNKNLSNLDEHGKAKPFSSFEAFLNTLTAKKRKNIRAERKKVAKQNLTCRIKTGNAITTADWEVFYQCYAMTYAVRGRQPYLTPAFFQQIGSSMAKNLMLAQGLDEEGHVIASSLFFYDDPTQKHATLYGRYWGSLAEYDSLHFELCYYQGIEFAIAQGLAFFDPGTQGEHKLVRGFVPTKTHSLHRIYDARFEPAIGDFCEQDREHMAQYRQQAFEALPFNIDNMPNFKG